MTLDAHRRRVDEGEPDDILDAVRHLHEPLHVERVPRPASDIEIGTRIGAEPTRAGCADWTVRSVR